MVRKIFISSVQRELSAERKAIVDLVSGNPQLARCFSTFAFEFDVPAADKRTDEVYLAELAVSDLYVGIIGNDYGGLTSDGISATESEYDEATRLGIPRFIFVKGSSDKMRDPRERKFLRKVSPGLIRVRFKNTEELLAVLTESLDLYLAENKVAYAGLTYEEEPVGKWEELDEDKIRWFVRTAREKRQFPLPVNVPIEQLLMALELLDDDGRLLNPAALLFGKRPQKFFITSEVKCAQFYADRVSKPMADHQIYTGDVFELVDQATRFVMTHISNWVGTRETGDTAEVPTKFELPYDAVKEAIVNAVVHRDYTSNASVQVMLFKDRLEVWSPGGLPRGMTIGKLFAAHKSVPVNPLLARAMYLKGYIEKSGTGTGDMIAKCANWGVPAPEWYEDDPDDFRVVLKRPVSEIGEEKTEQKSRVKSRVKSSVKSRGVNLRRSPNDGSEIEQGRDGRGVKSRVKTRVKSRVKIMSSAERIIAYLMANPEASAHELSIVVNLSVKGVEKNLRVLKESNRLRRVGPDKGGHWEVIG